MHQPFTDIEGRRVKVADLMLARKSTREIARALGVSQPTARRDVAAIREEWQAHRLGACDEIKSEDLARLDAAERAIWDQITAGKLFAIDRLLAIMERRAKLLGLDAPSKVNITHELRERALAEGLDPDEVVRAAEEIVKATR